MNNSFDPYSCPLDGVNLIEAGAGTGKTYTIQILITRLVLDGIDIKKILTVTFTEAATAELRDRIHRILTEMRNTLNELVCQNEEQQLSTIARLPEQIRGFFTARQPEDASRDWRRDFRQALHHVKIALQHFDQAPISTIHGFCNRMLNENAFESGIRFGLQPRADISAVANEIIHDFVRTQLYGDNIRRTWLWASLSINPRSLFNDIRPIIDNIGAEIDWGMDEIELNDPEKAVLDTENEITEVLRQLKDPKFWQDKFPDLSGLKFRSGDSARYSPDNVSLLTHRFIHGIPTSPDDLKHFTTEAFLKTLLKKGEKNDLFRIELQNGTSKHNCISLFEKLIKLMSRYKTFVNLLASNYFTRHLELRKNRDNFVTFNDMLSQLDQRLQDQQTRDKLCEIIQDKYACVLVDEFQDTDPVQYNIFQRLFAESEKHAFFMIGDPKQAIYSFRGGDIFAYLTASRKVKPEKRYTLTTNYRSTDEYINALNKFFGEQNPFKHEEIVFSEIQNPANNKKYFKSANPPANFSPLSFQLTSNTSSTAKNIVGVIKYLVSDPDLTICLDGTPRRPCYRDIAILVRNAHHSKDIELLLQQENIPFIWTNAGNVFQTRESEELLDLLQAVHNFSNSKLVSKVLASRLFACRADVLSKLHANHMSAIQLYFESLNSVWEKKSFLAMFRLLLEHPHSQAHPWLLEVASETHPAEGNISQLLIRQNDGKRSLTNFLHLGECLHQAAMQRKLGREGLISFLKKQQQPTSNTIADNSENEDEDDTQYAMRMATENDAVLITTLHKSKGLQFPFVLIPQLLRESPKEFEKLYHGDDNQRRLDFTVGHDQRAACYKEALQEAIRILYVGVTRAIFACHVCSSKSTQSLKIPSPDGPHAPDVTANYSLLEALKPQLNLFTEPQLTWTAKEDTSSTDDNDIEEMEKTAGETAKAVDKAAGNTATPIDEAAVKATEAAALPSLHPALEFKNSDYSKLVPGWRTCSFSSLSSYTSPATSHSSATYAEGTAANNAVDAFLADDDDATATPALYNSQGDLFEDDDDLDEEELDTGTGEGIPTGASHAGGLLPFQEREPIFQFRGGKQAGLYWHSIFEKLNFQADDQELTDTIIAELERYSQLPAQPEQRERQLQAFLNMTKGILRNTMPRGFQLCQVAPDKKLTELRFLYCLHKNVHSSKLTDILRQFGIAVPDKWEKHIPRQTAMTGSIDLLMQTPDNQFFLLDWKTNCLQYDWNNFSQQGMQAEMDSRFYTLQYLIYTVAFLEFYQTRTNQKITRELYEKIFGGVLYLFMRGIIEEPTSKSPPRGVFYTLPPYPLVELLRQEIGIDFSDNP